MPASYSFMLADATGGNLGELTTATGRSISAKRNSYTEVTGSLSHEDDTAALLWNAVNNTGMPTLKVYRFSPVSTTLVFNGYLAPFSEDAEEQATLNFVFRSPFGRYVGEGSNRGRFVIGGVTYTQTDAGQIAKALIDTTNVDSFAGLSTGGSIEATKLRDRTYPDGTNVGEAVTNLTNVLDGFDFTERFVEQGSTLALFDVFARQGSDRAEARFEYGSDTLSNARSFSRATEPPVNVARVLGGNALVGTALHQPSIDRYGKWYWQESRSDVTEQATLNDKAYALLRPSPVRTIGFVPELGLDTCPKPWDGFWLGDTVRVFARRGALNEDLTVRINAVTVAIDDNGFETAETQDPTTPEEESVIRSQIQVEAAAP